MSEISISVVIPVYNGAERVSAVLDALALQDAANGSFEVIVVDNASTDGIAERIWRESAIGQLS